MRILIWLDGELLSKQATEGLQSVQQQCEEVMKSGRYIQTIRINGEEKGLEEVLQGSIEKIDDVNIEIETCSLDELVENTMYSVVDYSPKLHAAWMKAVDSWRVGEWGIGTNQFLAGLDGLKWNLSVAVDLSALGPDDSEICEIARQGQKFLSPILEALEREDYIQLADILEFQGIPWLNRWYSLALLFKQQMRLENLKKTAQ